MRTGEAGDNTREEGTDESHLLHGAKACPAEQSVTTERYGSWEWTPRCTCCWLVGGESCCINVASSQNGEAEWSCM